LAHELGHLWGIDDLYTHDKKNLDSIYSKPFSFSSVSSVSRHDKNAMRIGLNDLWFYGANGAWYYQPSAGVWSTSEWKQIGGSWYYFLSTSIMATGWQKIGSYWYYLSGNGIMKTGWFYDDGYWYYLRTATNTPTTGPQGSMLISTTCTIGGTSYQFDGHGHCLNP
jgi:hypothetical protein